MKLLIFIAVFVGVATGYEVFTCNAPDACTKPSSEFKCNSLLKGFKHIEPNLADFVNEQLTNSFDYLMLATHFNTFNKNRPGFHKLFQGLSDKAWDQTVSMIKHITKRGGSVPNVGILSKNAKSKNYIKPSTSVLDSTFEMDEVQAMALALDYEKTLATEVQHLHHTAFHGKRTAETLLKTNENHDVFKHYDPETAHYLEEEFLEPQTETIRKLAGYANDLAKLAEVPDPSLAYYLFDEYLAKQ